MRKTASEVINELERRITRLERKASVKYVDLEYIYKLALLFGRQRGVESVKKELQSSGRNSVSIYLANGNVLSYEIHMRNGLLALTPDGAVGWGPVSFDAMKDILNTDIQKYS
jgi:hypothetical protein